MWSALTKHHLYPDSDAEIKKKEEEEEKERDGWMEGESEEAGEEGMSDSQTRSINERRKK